jgi:hypothetical protein
MQSMFGVKCRSSYRWALVVPLLMLADGAGCGGSGDGLDRQVVTGTITLDGTPLPTGTIRLDPTSQSAGTQVSSTISNGKYSLGKDEGPVPGTYKVQISSAEDPKFTLPAGKTPGEAPVPVAKEKVPNKYNINSTLTMTVKSGQSEPIDFPLTSK